MRLATEGSGSLVPLSFREREVMMGKVEDAEVDE